MAMWKPTEPQLLAAFNDLRLIKRRANKLIKRIRIWETINPANLSPLHLHEFSQNKRTLADRASSMREGVETVLERKRPAPPSSTTH